MKKEEPVDADTWDFGFTAVNEAELETHATVESLKEKIDALYAAIQPLLQNLKANPEKDFIRWPNRLEKISEFEAKLRKIYEK